MNRKQSRRYARRASRSIRQKAGNRIPQTSSRWQTLRVIVIVVVVGLMIILVALRPFTRAGLHAHGAHSRWR